MHPGELPCSATAAADKTRAQPSWQKPLRPPKAAQTHCGSSSADQLKESTRDQHRGQEPVDHPDQSITRQKELGSERSEDYTNTAKPSLWWHQSY